MLRTPITTTSCSAPSAVRSVFRGAGAETRGSGGFLSPAARCSISGDDSSVKIGMFGCSFGGGGLLWAGGGEAEERMRSTNYGARLRPLYG